MTESSTWTQQELIDILDHDLISTRYFYPQRLELPGAFWVETGGGRLACWRSSPPSNKPILVHFHGNGELVHHWIPDLTPWIQAQGYEVLFAEYRGYGASQGTPKLASMLEDVAAIVTATGVPAKQLVAFGRSIGSLYAIEMVHRFPSTAGLVLESGIADLQERLLLRVRPEELGCSQALFDTALDTLFNQEKKLQSYRNPSLFLHAEQDHLVRIEHAERNHAAAGSADKELVRFPMGDHNSILMMNYEAYMAKLGQFMAKVCTPDPA